MSSWLVIALTFYLLTELPSVLSWLYQINIALSAFLLPLLLLLCPFPHCQKLRRGLPGSPQHLRLSHPLVFPSYRFSLISTAKKILIADIPTWETATDDNRRFAIIVFNLQISVSIRKESGPSAFCLKRLLIARFMKITLATQKQIYYTQLHY